MREQTNSISHTNVKRDNYQIEMSWNGKTRKKYYQYSTRKYQNFIVFPFLQNDRALI